MNVNDTSEMKISERKYKHTHTKKAYYEEIKRVKKKCKILYQMLTEFRLSTSFFICSCEACKTIDYTHFTTIVNRQFIANRHTQKRKKWRSEATSKTKSHYHRKKVCVHHWMIMHDLTLSCMEIHHRNGDCVYTLMYVVTQSCSFFLFAFLTAKHIEVSRWIIRASIKCQCKMKIKHVVYILRA